MKVNEYIPKGFDSWHQFHKYQTAFDCVMCVLVGIISAVSIILI